MRHARIDALDHLEPLLGQVRAMDGMIEKGRGVFYRKSRAFLHFHEDSTGLYADLRLVGEDFDRFKVDSPGEQDALIARIKAALP